MIAATFSDPLFLLGLVLMFAVLLGAATEQVGVPWITGCIVAGVLLGPSLLGLLKSTALHDFGVFLQASLALIAFSIGSRLTLPKLSAIGASIAWLTVLQLLAPMILVLVALAAIGVSWPTAIIAAAVAPATAPTTTYAIVQRRKASGLFVDRALGILAINDAATILIFSVVSAAIVAWLGAETANGGAFSRSAAPYCKRGCRSRQAPCSASSISCCTPSSRTAVRARRTGCGRCSTRCFCSPSGQPSR